MLQILNLTKTYGSTTVLSDLSLMINRADRVGLIGPNGVGKSTLLRCIVGLERPDQGQIIRTPPNLSIGYLPQTFATLASGTVADALDSALAEYRRAEQALQHTAEAMANSAPNALECYDLALSHFEALGGYQREQRATEIMDTLGLRNIERTFLVSQLSGGQKTRLGLALLLLQEPDLLLLDEPTNHLDVTALEWLEAFVTTYHGAVLIVSHDRRFLDQTTNRILYLDPSNHTLRSYIGNYSAFAAARAHEHELHVETWKKQQDHVGRVEADIARLKGQALNVELTTTPRQPNVRRLAKKVAKKALSRERKLERYQESDERVEKPRQTWGLKLDFGLPPSGSRGVVRVEQLRFSYQPSSADDLLHDVSFEIDYGERVAITGPNGAGKTTLLRLLTGGLSPTAGTIRIGAGVQLGVLTQEQETLEPSTTVLDTIRRERPMSETEARNILHFFLFAGDSVFRPVERCSPGERARLQLALLVLRGCNLLVLDEPLNHLDIEGREHFEQALSAFSGTVIVVSHDRAFVDSFAERVLEVRAGTVQTIW
jgi:ATP-binding cassette subfamily F protein 3